MTNPHGKRDTPAFNGVKIINPDPSKSRTVTVGLLQARNAPPVATSDPITVDEGQPTATWTPPGVVKGVVALTVEMTDGDGQSVDFGACGVGRKLENDQVQYVVNAQVTWGEDAEQRTTFITEIMSSEDPDTLLRRATLMQMPLPGMQTAVRITPADHGNLALQLPFLPPSTSSDPIPVRMRNGIHQKTYGSPGAEQVSTWTTLPPPGDTPNPARAYTVICAYIQEEPVPEQAILAQWTNTSVGVNLAGEYVSEGSEGLANVDAWRFIQYETFDGSGGPQVQGYQIVNVGGSLYPSGSGFGAGQDGNGFVLVSPNGNDGTQVQVLEPDSATGEACQFWNLTSV